MMIKIKSLLIICLFILGISCSQDKKSDITYQFQDMPYPVECSAYSGGQDAIDPDLLKEAVWSFQNDITNYYGRDYGGFIRKDLATGFREFVWGGLDGVARYQEIASPHSWMLLEELKKVEGLWNPDGIRSNLNYDHPLMQCLQDNFKHEEIKEVYDKLDQANSLGPKVLRPIMTKHTLRFVEDPYLATYLAFDGFYNYLYDLERPKQPQTDE
ncbi:hypothetical protein [Croceiramulus getboli]|nr:hypothetical protein P8624_11550 [Flavobacteriaceae bacterium YJPT1-3]